MLFIYLSIRACLCGLMTSLMGFPIWDKGHINLKSLFILIILVLLFNITDEIVKKSKSQ